MGDGPVTICSLRVRAKHLPMHPPEFTDKLSPGSPPPPAVEHAQQMLRGCHEQAWVLVYIEQQLAPDWSGGVGGFLSKRFEFLDGILSCRFDDRRFPEWCGSNCVARFGREWPFYPASRLQPVEVIRPSVTFCLLGINIHRVTWSG